MTMEFSTFPMELRQKIYYKCTQASLSNISRTSKSFHEEVMPALWSNLEITWDFLERQWMDGNVSQKIEKYTSSLKIHEWGSDEKVEGKLYAKFLLFVGSCNGERLRTLDLEDRGVPHILQYAACHFTNLEKLVLDNRDFDLKLTVEELEHLNRFPRLKSLTLGDYADMNQRIWEKICQMETLETLKLDSLYWEDYDPDYVVRHSKLKNLRHLEVHHNFDINNDFLTFVGSNCVNLEHLDISDNETRNYEDPMVIDVGVACISQILSLKYLDLSNSDHWIKPELTDAGILSLSKLPALETLNLRGVCKQVTNQGLLHLSQITTLTNLNISNMGGVTDEGFQHLANLTSLVRITMYNLDKLTNSSLETISKLKLLKSLEVLGCVGFTDAGLHHLVGLQHLKFWNYQVSGVFSKEALDQHGLVDKRQSNDSLGGLFCHFMALGAMK